MTSNQLRTLADSLERDFITQEDRKAWVTALRGHAKSVAECVMVHPSYLRDEEERGC